MYMYGNGIAVFDLLRKINNTIAVLPDAVTQIFDMEADINKALDERTNTRVHHISRLCRVVMLI
jgi:hypothetical protein